jgi:hypothetical protein
VGTEKTRLTDVDEDAGSEAMEHPTSVDPLREQFAPPFAEENVNPEGNVSSRTTFVAVEGPRFCAVNVYVMVLPRTTEVGPIFVTVRSAFCAGQVIPVCTWAMLFVETGSVRSLETAAVFVTVVGRQFWVVGTKRTRFTVADEEGAREATEQFTAVAPVA